MRLASRAAAAAVAAAALATPLLVPDAQGAGADAAAPFRQTLTSATAVARTNCATTQLAGRRGVATTTWTPGAPVFIHAALDGARTDDWDLAIFDHASGRRIGGSGAWGASEVVTARVPAGRALDVQACRLSGTSRSAKLEIATTVLPLDGMAKLPGAPKLVEISLPNRQAIGVLDTAGIDLADNPHADGDSIAAFIRSDDELRLLDQLGFRYRVRIADVDAFDRRQRARTAAYSRAMQRQGGSPLPSGRSEYRMYEDYLAELKKLAADYPAIVRPVTLPKKTFQGRDQVGVEISSDVARTDDQKPVSFLMGVHHAREWPAGELIMEMAYYLAKGFGTNDAVTELLKHTRVVIVPIINPDGFVSSRTADDPADTIDDPTGIGAPNTAESAGNGGSFAYRRKNCKGEQGPEAPCDLNGGVDPNRNYGLGWGGRGASTMPNSQSYRGPGPFSEEETQSVHAFSQTHDITSLLSMHNFASLVLRPPGRHTDGQAPDEAALKDLGDKMAADTGYTSQYGFQLYDTSGTTEDWNYGAAGTFGYTMELGPESGDGGNFHISYDRGVVEQWVGQGELGGLGVRRALMRMVEAAAQRVHHSTLIGRAPAGRILRLHKDFKTATSPVCRVATVVDLNINPQEPIGERPDACIDEGDVIRFDDKLDYTTRVPANSVFSWIVTPSTRPFEFKAGKREKWTLTCEDDAGKVYEQREVEIWRNEVQSFEMPCGGTLPSGATPVTVAQAESFALVDRQPPESTLDRRKLRMSRRGIFLQGRSRDLAPQGLTPRVAKVRVTIGQHVGNLCRYLDAEGKFGKKIRCKRTPYVISRVKAPNATVRWKYSLGAKLPKGRYFAWVRGIDAAGNVERKHRPRNLVKFRIR
jgi:zinc carboxypeptidase